MARNQREDKWGIGLHRETIRALASLSRSATRVAPVTATSSLAVRSLFSERRALVRPTRQLLSSAQVSTFSAASNAATCCAVR